jgi:hypothetical protein
VGTSGVFGCGVCYAYVLLVDTWGIIPTTMKSTLNYLG